MNARERMVEKAARAIYDQEDLHTDMESAREDARVALDAVLPQVITVAEIDAMPIASIITDGEGSVYRRMPDRWWDRPGSVACVNSAGLHSPKTSWTVVWNPEVTA